VTSTMIIHREYSNTEKAMQKLNLKLSNFGRRRINVSIVS
jgi:hypothetical protein